MTTKLKTSRKRLRSKLGKVKAWLTQNRHRVRLPELWKIFGKKREGHIRYYGVSFNSHGVAEFVRRARDLVFKWINRRSQKRSMNWQQFSLFMQRYPLPRVKIYVSLF